MLKMVMIWMIMTMLLMMGAQYHSGPLLMMMMILIMMMLLMMGAWYHSGS